MEHRIRLCRRAIQRIRHTNRNHRPRRQSSPSWPPAEEAEAAPLAQPAPAPGEGAAAGGGGGGGGRRVLRHYLLMPPLWLQCGGAGLAARDRSHHQVIDHRSDPIHRSAIRRSQRTGSVIVYLAIQRSHTIGHSHLNVLPRQRRLTRDLRLDISCRSADRLVPEAEPAARLASLAARVCSALWGRVALTSRPQDQQTSQNRQRRYCVALQNQSSWGKSSVLRLLIRLLIHLDEEKHQLAGTLQRE